MELKGVLEIIRDAEHRSCECIIEFKDGTTLQIDPEFVDYDEKAGRITFGNCIELDE